MRVCTTETNDELKTLLVMPSMADSTANQTNAVGGSSPEMVNYMPMVRYIRFTRTMRFTR